jgi:hypothetical protein
MRPDPGCHNVTIGTFPVMIANTGDPHPAWLSFIPYHKPLFHPLKPSNDKSPIMPFFSFFAVAALGLDPAARCEWSLFTGN